MRRAAGGGGGRGVITALAVAALGLGPGSARAGDPLAEIEAAQQALFEKIAPSVVYIVQAGGIGSGFFISADGLILTNAHVVQGVEKVDVILHDGRKLEGAVIERGEDDLDVALIKVSAGATRPVEVAPFTSLRIGGWIGAVGQHACQFSPPARPRTLFFVCCSLLPPSFFV